VSSVTKRDYYEVLGLDRQATDQQIKSAYRKMALKYHPDRNPGDHKAEEAFKEAAEAYSVLADREKRSLYDRFGHAGVAGAGAGAAGFDPTIFADFSDIFSGYRVFSRRFVKSFPVLSSGFEIETEISVHALELRMPVGEVETVYAARPEGSESKLSTFRDGWRILKTIATLYRIERPVLFFGSIGALLVIAAIIFSIPLVLTYLDTGLVPRFPTAILATGLVIIAVLCFFAGLILDTVTRGRREMRRLAYLAVPGPVTEPA